MKVQWVNFDVICVQNSEHDGDKGDNNSLLCNKLNEHFINS